MIAAEKVPRFLEKMAHRYPAILRNTRERSYDRHRRARAAMHLIVCAPVGSDLHGPLPVLQWWLLSDEGAGGLADPESPDAHVASHAMSASTHITAHDYVLLYATKRTPHAVTDHTTGRVRRIWADTSTWTWKIRGSVMTEIRASIDECCRSLQLGAETTEERAGWGLRGLLAAQRGRPLFSGVRNQVIDLHRGARELWCRYRTSWLAAHPQLLQEQGPIAGTLPSLKETIALLPTMRQLRVYETPRRTIRDLLLRSPSSA